MKLTKNYIDSLASNQNAISNAQGLVSKNNFVALSKTADEQLLFGECMGSGKDNYRVSADFIKPDHPVLRCTCPSRQYPCKHALGLLYAFILGKKFQVAETPPEIIELRQRDEQKAAKKEKRKNSPESASPKKVNLAALEKKIKAQLQGIDLLEKLVHNLVRSGLGTLNPRSIQIYEEQAKQLGDYYLPGAQDIFGELLWDLEPDESPEIKYRRSLPLLLKVYALVRKGREYLTQKMADPQDIHEVETPIEELLGHAWQLNELKGLGLVEQNVELVQLAFFSYEAEAHREFVDIGTWVNLHSGMIQETLNYRPYKAAAHLRADDSTFQMIHIKELFIYPGDLNPRIRWEEAGSSEITPADLRKIKSLANESYADVIKAIKNQLKNPLARKNPLQLLSYTKIARADGALVMENKSGERLVLIDIPGSFEPPSTPLLNLLTQSELTDQAILVRFHNDFKARTLRVQPLSIITDVGIIRLI